MKFLLTRLHFSTPGVASILARCLLAACLSVSPTLHASGAEADPATTENTTEEIFQHGLSAYDKGDYATALKIWQPLADANNMAAQRNIGHLYRLGKGVAQDLAKAVEYYSTAAELGLASAQSNLADMHLKGLGVPRNEAVAVRLFTKSALQGHVAAQYRLGHLYEQGIGVPADEARAIGWFHLAAKAGHKEALEHLTRLVVITSVPERADSKQSKRQSRMAAQRAAAASFADSEIELLITPEEAEVEAENLASEHASEASDSSISTSETDAGN